MAKRKTTKSKTSKKKTTTSQKRSTSKRTSTSGKGFNATSKARYNALLSLVDYGYVARLDDSKKTLAQELSSEFDYSATNKSAAVNSLVQGYSFSNPEIFKKGGVFDKLVAKIKANKNQGRTGVKKFLEDLAGQGQLTETAEQYSDATNPLLRQLMGQQSKKQVSSQQQRGTMERAYATQFPVTGVPVYSENNYANFTRPYLLDSEGKADYNKLTKLGDVLNTLTAFRFGVINLQQRITYQYNQLKGSSKTGFFTNTLTDSTQAEFKSLQENVIILIDSITTASKKYNITVMVKQDAGSGTYRDVTEQISDSSTLAKVNPTSGAIIYSATLGQIKALRAPTKKDEVADYLQKIALLVSSESTFTTFWQQSLKGYAEKQQNYYATEVNRINNEGRNNAGKNVVTLATTIQQELRGIAVAIHQKKLNGQLAPSEYNTLSARFKVLVRELGSLPGPQELYDKATTGRVGMGLSGFTVAVAKELYKYQILQHKVVQLKQEVNAAQDITETLEKLKSLTKAQIVSRLKATQQSYASYINVAQDPTLALAQRDNLLKARKGMNRLNKLIRDISSSSINSTAAKTLVAKSLIGDEGAAFKANIKIAGVLAGQSRVDDYAKIAKSQKSELGKMSSDAWQGQHQKAMFLLSPQAVYMMEPFSKLEGDSKEAMQAAGMKIINLQGKLGQGLVGVTILPAPSSNDPRDLIKELPSAVQSLPYQQAKARALAAKDMITKLKTKYQSMIALNAQELTLGNAFSSNATAIQNNINRFKGMLKSVKYDKTLSGDGIGYTAGLHLTGYLRSNTATLSQTCPFAIEQYEDLLWFPVFRGNTARQLSSQRNKMYTIDGKERGLLSDPMGPAGSEATYLIRRHMVNDFGEPELYDWNPAQAEDLRIRTFVSLYPFSLNNAEFKEIYDAKIELLRTGKEPDIQTAKQQANVEAGLSILGIS